MCYDVYDCDESGVDFGDGKRKVYTYLMVISVQSDLVIKLDREVFRKEETIKYLRRQLQ